MRLEFMYVNCFETIVIWNMISPYICAEEYSWESVIPEIFSVVSYFCHKMCLIGQTVLPGYSPKAWKIPTFPLFLYFSNIFCKYKEKIFSIFVLVQALFQKILSSFLEKRIFMSFKINRPSPAHTYMSVGICQTYRK